jgi:Ankyrin repeat
VNSIRIREVMGSSASVTNKPSSCSHGNTGKFQLGKSKKGNEPTKLSAEGGAVENVTSSSEDALLLLHKFSAGSSPDEMTSSWKGSITMEDIQALQSILTLSSVAIDGTLELFQLPEAEIENYLTMCDSQETENARSSTSHGIPTSVGGTSQAYNGLYPHVTPLMQAVLHGNLKAVEMLIDIGANVNATTPCDVSYYRSDLPVIPKGSSVMMLALYRLFDIRDYLLKFTESESPALVTRIPRGPPEWRESILICKLLLCRPEIDIHRGISTAEGERVSAVTIAGTLVDALRSSSDLMGRSVVSLSQRILTDALTQTMKAQTSECEVSVPCVITGKSKGTAAFNSVVAGSNV